MLEYYFNNMNVFQLFLNPPKNFCFDCKSIVNLSICEHCKETVCNSCLVCENGVYLCKFCAMITSMLLTNKPKSYKHFHERYKNTR